MNFGRRGGGNSGGRGFGGFRTLWKGQRTHFTKVRTARTAESPPLVRRMDALARLMHVEGAIVTSIGFDSRRRGMLIAANQHPRGYTDQIADRGATLQEFLRTDFKGDRDARRAAALSTMEEMGGAGTRFMRDLIKLNRSVQGEYAAGSGRNFSAAQRESILSDTWNMHKLGDDVHAELDVARRAAPGPMGVTKLSCRDCHDYIIENYRHVQIRGTHAHSFPGWKEPRRRTNAGWPASDGDAKQQEPDDSGSESEG